MSKRIFSGLSSAKFWNAVNKSKYKDILYEYGCKAQEIEADKDELLKVCKKAHKEGYEDGYADGVETDGCVENNIIDQDDYAKAWNMSEAKADIAKAEKAGE